MTIQPLAAGYSALSPIAKLAVAGALVAVVLLISGAIGGVVTRLKDARFDRAQAEAQQERDEMQRDRDVLLRRAEAAEAKAAILEEQAVALRQVADSAALTAKQSQARADQIAQETALAVAAVGDLPPAEAQRDIHDRLVKLGLLKDAK
jgi:predicted Zn-dependent peptidase